MASPSGLGTKIHLDQGLVSCVMTTRDRRHFFAQALRCFFRQTYKDSELIVVDDGEAPVADLCTGLPRVRYIRVGKPTSIGAKLNIGLEQAEGSIFLKPDDDDYYHPDFLKLAVWALAQGGPKRSIVNWDCFLVLLAGEDKTRFSGHGWAAGATLCFSRELWEERPFRDDIYADSWFLKDHNHSRHIKVCAPEYYMYVRHGKNAWNTMCDGANTDAKLRTLPEYPKSLEEFLEPPDVRFYRSLEQAP